MKGDIQMNNRIGELESKVSRIIIILEDLTDIMQKPQPDSKGELTKNAL